MMTLMRTIIEVPDEVIKSLDQFGAQQNQSRAALIREAIAQYLEGKSSSSAAAAFGVWEPKGIDGLNYQNELRSEWDY